MKHKIRSFALASCVILASPAYSLEIILTDISDSPAEVLAAFEAAAAIWESTVTDDVTVRINVGYESLDPGVLGSAGSASMWVDYTDVRAAMIADATSAADAMAIGSLTDTDGFEFLARDVNNADLYWAFGDGGGLAVNEQLDVNTANLKALGMLGDVVGADAGITFSSDFAWDFNPGDGIDAGAFDFIGVAAHEIGHSLGFVSGVDLMDIISTPSGPFAGCCNMFGADADTDIAANAIFSTLDLFRYSDFSANFVGDLVGGGGPYRDFTFGEDYASIFGTPSAAGVYFSLDGGATSLGSFSTGSFNGVGSGGGRQASHWEDNLGLGLMDPTASPGEMLGLTDRDRIAMDAIGWDLVAVPEPGTLSMMLLGLGCLVAARRRRQKV